ncbi:MAG TPA: universal stress protein [Pyrinomonadaceae bacterium]|nr:universal stress protein [Pyrinomonadaceae bacterium]
MKLLVAYDGSECADAALDDLTHAGLPEKGEALVMTVAEAWLPPPPPSAFEIVNMARTAHSPLDLQRKYASGHQAVVDADQMAKRAAAQFASNFPDWKVSHEASWGSATWELFSKAEEFNSDLIIVGSHGRSALGRLVLGSISQWLLNEARCSVRIARGRLDEPDFPVRILVGIDGSRNSKAAVEQIAARNWPPLSEVRVVQVDQPVKMTYAGHFIPPVKEAIEDVNQTEFKKIQRRVKAAASKLQAAGLRTMTDIVNGDPKKVLVELAEEWHADCIFLGATGLSNRLGRFLLGSVAGAVAARAHCSVEIVRTRRRKSKTNGNGN